MDEFFTTISLSQEQAFLVMRSAAAVFFVAVALCGLVVSPFFLTPELRTDLPGIVWLQVVAGVCAILRRTTPVTGMLILVFYALGINQYGLFHMLDYFIFLGIAVFFLLSGIKRPRWIAARYITLFASTALTLLWAAIEKWGYPHWTFELLHANPDMLMGMSPEFFMFLSGFVEFNLTFILLSSASSGSRAIAFGLNAIFVLSIFKFGIVDAIGHLLIIAVLVVLVLRGPTNARYFLVLPTKSLATEAYFMTGLYVLAFNLVFIAYYGLQALA